MFRWDFDGDLDSLLKGVKDGEAVFFNPSYDSKAENDGAGIPIRNAKIQGKRLLLPLPHRTLEVDLTSACSVAKNGNHVIIKLEFVGS